MLTKCELTNFLTRTCFYLILFRIFHRACLLLNVIKQINYPRFNAWILHIPMVLYTNQWCARRNKRGEKKRGNIVQGEINQRVFFFLSIRPYYIIQLSSITQVFSFISSPHSNTLFSQEVLSLTHTVMLLRVGGDGTMAILFLFIVFSFWYYCSFYTHFLILWSFCLLSGKIISHCCSVIGVLLLRWDIWCDSID